MNPKSIFKSLSSALILGVFVCFTSCSPEEEISAEATFNEEFGKFTKAITLHDEKGENSAVLKIGSNDQSILDMWTADNFILTPIKEGQTLEEAIHHLIELDDGIENQEADIDEDESDEVAAEISTMFLSKTLKPGIRSVALTIKDPYNDDMRGWKYDSHYSVALEGNTVTMNVYGHNMWHRGYWACWYKHTSSHGWGELVGQWRRIRNGESEQETESPCYQMKGRRKYKGGNDSVTIEFED